MASDLTLESKACAACAKAKRRCGKQIPTCYRCASKSIRCEYSHGPGTFSLPSQKSGDDRTSGDHVQPSTSAAAGPLAVSVSEPLLDLPENHSTLEDLLAMDFDYTIPSDMLNLTPKSYSLPWYLESASWEIGRAPYAEISTPFCHSVFMKYIGRIQEWQARWVKTGSNPYIHKHLYQFMIPKSILDAFTMLSTYLNATPETQPLVLHMLEERVTQLLRDQPKETKDADALNPFEHLARVQALHIYQTLGLFSGGIRARHVAETQIPTLNEWMRAMIESAKSTASQGVEAFARTLLTPRGEPDPPKHQGPRDQAVGLFAPDYMPTLLMGDAKLSAEDTAWYAWVLSESIRRVWVVAAATQSVFLALQLKWSPCPGSTVFSTRADLWEAGSAYTWASRCKQRKVDDEAGLDFVERGDWERILESRGPEEVDEFTTSGLEVTFGSERIDQWNINTRKES
ncbi:hypothetical protein N0V93_005412 [Gnomoniopsis smithogilvyi]|uniref:Zn(2)-C6 fungal-type domain-containing protein n=1 Tax=Gnomoniopsis smithogilvyi TaxID=1191159 RepID=A0A9W8YSU6_9PEZI|nr:hypothetical protein N0V93_005412 [Gnomoniopsis smithogilvyi]